MKGALDKKIFLKICEHVLTYQGKIDGILDYESFKDYGPTNYRTTLYRAKKNKWEINITEDEFYNILSEPCYFCGKWNTDINCNGIDRYDSNIGYLKYNCVSCCGVCNYMKKKYDYDVLIEKMMEIYENTRNMFVNDRDIVIKSWILKCEISDIRFNKSIKEYNDIIYKYNNDKGEVIYDELKNNKRENIVYLKDNINITKNIILERYK